MEATRRYWIAANALGAVLAATLVSVFILKDRDEVLDAVEARTQSSARMIAAHGEFAIGDAAKIVAAIRDRATAWDLADTADGRALFDALRELLVGSPHLSSAWILDAEGTSRLDSWSFPSRLIPAADRAYFRRHLAGAPDPVVAGVEQGSVTSRPRFTYSHALRNPDGSLHAVIVVGIYSNGFDTLYAEAARWPGARAGLYLLDGQVLARLRGPPPATPEFVAELQRHVRAAPSGSALISEGAESRLASWQRSELYPELYATSSQTVSAALADWRWRSALLAATAAVAVIGFALFTMASLRSIAARQRVELHEIAVREVHHRVKNWLQLVISMTRLRAQRSADPAVVAELARLGDQLFALADVQDILQNSRALGQVRLDALLAQLCQRLQLSHAGAIDFRAERAMTLDTGLATPAAIILNELVTNAMKHARERVEVRLDGGPAEATITVTDDGPGLPDGFQIRGGQGFGLRAALALADNIGAELSAEQGGAGGARFRLRLPLGAGAAVPAGPDTAGPDTAAPSGPAAAHTARAAG